jgi:hypothetical protein
MAEIKAMTTAELHEVIDMGLFGGILVATSDIEKQEDKGTTRCSKVDAKKLVDTCKTIIAMIDDAGEEDSLDIYALYTALQEDIFNIKPVGLEHKVILLPKM